MAGRWFDFPGTHRPVPFQELFISVHNPSGRSVQTVFVQGLKRFVFPGLVRPKMYFEDFGSFRQIEDIQFYSNNAFPSGHTATAFTCALILSLFLEDKRWSIGTRPVAISVGHLQDISDAAFFYGCIFRINLRSDLSDFFSLRDRQKQIPPERFGNRSLMS
jgi:hypothetical protein